MEEGLVLLTDLTVRRLARTCKRIGAFNSLSHNDQIILLKGPLSYLP